jgi:hypothetical protein
LLQTKNVNGLRETLKFHGLRVLSSQWTMELPDGAKRCDNEDPRAVSTEPFAKRCSSLECQENVDTESRDSSEIAPTPTAVTFESPEPTENEVQIHDRREETEDRQQFLDGGTNLLGVPSKVAYSYF